MDLAFIFGGLGDFFGLDEQEPLALLHQRAEFVVGLETHLTNPVCWVRPGLNPIRAVLPQVGTEGVPGSDTCVPGLPLGTVCHRLQGHPSLAPTQEIMIRQGQEVVSALAVRLGDHFREVVAVRPERVRVQVALPPAQRLRSCRQARQVDEKTEDPQAGSPHFSWLLSKLFRVRAHSVSVSFGIRGINPKAVC